MATKEQEEYRFRISCRISSPTKPKVTEFEFAYVTLTEARRNYKAILLGLYRKRKQAGFSICLNRYRDRKWRHAIFKENG
jgi:hypothetical protein